ncbi:unnamed protein product [Colias eurytheme]|nr:unnamed protein product [Colias eurytheme]
MKCIILFACLIIGAKAKPFFEGERPLNVGRRGRLGVGMGGRNFRRGMDQSGVGYGIPDESGFIPGSYETGMSPGMGFDNGMGPEGIVFDDSMGPQTGMGYEPGMGNIGRGYGSQFANGQEYGGQEFNNGASGFGNQAIRNAGGKHYHNIGASHRKVSSINQEENDESHNIGSDSGFNTGAQSNGGFRNYRNGGSRYGNQYGQGSEGIGF